MLTLLRALAGLVLGLVVFAGLLYLLVLVNFSQRLVESEVYDIAISDTDAYNRIYDEVLVDEALKEQTGNLLGDVDIEAHEEAVDVLREVMPPAYLQEQTEENIDRFTAFLRYEQEELEVYASLKEPLERIEPAVLGKVHQLIDELEIKDPPSGGCSTEALHRLAAASAVPYAKFSEGEIPDSAPSLKILTPLCREQAFDRWFDRVLDDPAINSQAALILENEKSNLRRHFVEGDTRKFLKAAADPLVKPLIEDAIADIRRDLQRNDRFDLLDWLAEESDDTSRADIEEQAEALRNAVSDANGPGKFIALALVVAGALLMALVHLPRPAEMLRWPGITLVMGGVVCLLVGLVLNSAIPGQFRDAIARTASYSGDVPVSAINLAGDLVESFARQATAGFIPASVTVMIVGGLLIIASLASGILSELARRVIPGLNGNQRNR